MASVTPNHSERAPEEENPVVTNFNELTLNSPLSSSPFDSLQHGFLPEAKIHEILRGLCSQYLGINASEKVSKMSPTSLPALVSVLCRKGRLPFEIEKIATCEEYIGHSSGVRQKLSELFRPYISHLRFHPDGEAQPYMKNLLRAPNLHTVLIPADSHFLRDITGCSNIKRLSLVVSADSSVPRVSAVVVTLEALRSLEIRCRALNHHSCFFGNISGVSVPVGEAFSRVQWLILDCPCSGSDRGYWKLVRNICGPEILQLSKYAGQLRDQVLRHPLTFALSSSMKITSFFNFRTDVTAFLTSQRSGNRAEARASNRMHRQGARILTLKFCESTELYIQDILPQLDNLSYLDLEWKMQEEFQRKHSEEKIDEESKEMSKSLQSRQSFSDPWSMLSEAIRNAHRLEILRLSHIIMKRNQLRMILGSVSTSLKVLVLHISDTIKEENIFERLEYILELTTDLHPQLRELRIEGFEILNEESSNFMNFLTTMPFIQRIQVKLDRLQTSRSELNIEALRSSFEQYVSKNIFASNHILGGGLTI